jgi:hypothetical protein
MGLTINYELRLPGPTADEDAVQLLERLQIYALTLAPVAITPVLLLTGAELTSSLEQNSVEWFFQILADGIREERDGVAGPIADQQRLALAGFLMAPGEGSEPAMFGLVRPFLTQPSAKASDTFDWQDWCWHSFCKTQYASTISDEHFVRCHTTVVSMLDEAQRLGFGVTVHDEGDYWESRSTERLLLEVGKMNRIMAHFAGALHDAISPEHSVEAAIFEHPEFEHLEMESLDLGQVEPD